MQAVVAVGVNGLAIYGLRALAANAALGMANILQLAPIAKGFNRSVNGLVAISAIHVSKSVEPLRVFHAASVGDAGGHKFISHACHPDFGP